MNGKKLFTQKEIYDVLGCFSTKLKDIYINSFGLELIPFIAANQNSNFYINKNNLGPYHALLNSNIQNDLQSLILITRKIINFARFINIDIIALIQDYEKKLLSLDDIPPLLRATFYTNLMHPEYQSLINNKVLSNRDIFNDQFINHFSRVITSESNKEKTLWCTQNTLLDSFIRFLGRFQENAVNIPIEKQIPVIVFNQIIPKRATKNAFDTLEVIEKGVENLMKAFQSGTFYDNFEEITRSKSTKNLILISNQAVDLQKETCNKLIIIDYKDLQALEVNPKKVKKIGGQFAAITIM